MSSPVARFTPSRRYLSMALFAAAGTLLSLGIALHWGPVAWNPVPWSPAWIAAAFFALPAMLLLAVACRPAIEVYETHLRIGHCDIPWSQISRLDQTGWNVPLAVYLTFKDESRLLVIYPGDFDSSTSLLRHLRRYAREALLDGIPYRQFWGEPPAHERKQLPPPRYPLLLPEDEEEIERMFQRLKTVGHLERRNPGEK